MSHYSVHVHFFFFNDTATTEIYTLSLHDALPIYPQSARADRRAPPRGARRARARAGDRNARRAKRGAGRHGRGHAGRAARRWRSEEHTSELQSRQYLVCRLLLEKKNKINI